MPDSDSDSDYSLIDFPHTDSGGGGSDRPSSRNGLDVPPLGEEFEFLCIYEGKGKVDSQNVRKPDKGKEELGGEKTGGLSQAERLQLDADTAAFSKPYKQAHEVLKEFENEHGSQFTITPGTITKKLKDKDNNKTADPPRSGPLVPDPGQVDVKSQLPQAELPVKEMLFARRPIGKRIARKEAMTREKSSQHTGDSLKKHLEEPTKNDVSSNIPRPSDKIRDSGIRPPRVAIPRSSVAPEGTDTANTWKALFKPVNLDDISGRTSSDYERPPRVAIPGSSVAGPRSSGAGPRSSVACPRSSVALASTDDANTRNALFKPDNLEGIHAHPPRGYLSQAFPRIPKRALGQDEEDAEASDAGVKAVTGKPEPISELKASHVPITVRRTETPKGPVLPHLIWSEQGQQWVVSNISYVSPEVATELNLHIKNMASVFVQSREVRDRFRAIVHSGVRELDHPQHSCFGCSVLSGNRDLCSNERTDKTACDECVRLRRPCGRLCIDPRDRSCKSFAYGFLPLPKELREVDDHRELRYYVRHTMMG